MLDLNAPETRWTGVREVMGMSWPIILGSLSYTIMLFVDTAMVARLGTENLAAIGSAGLWSYILGCFILGVVGCVSTFVSQSMGRGAMENCARYAWQGLYISLAAILLALILWPISGPLFRMLPHTPEVTRLETIYFQVRLPGYVMMAMTTALAAFFQAIGRPSIPMKVAIIANLTNAGLNYLLIYGKFGFPNWGIGGAAAATVIAMTLQVAMLMCIFLSEPIDAKFASRAAFRLDSVKVRELLRIGLPAGAMFFMDIFNWGIFSTVIVGYFGAVTLASHNAAMSFMHLCFMPAVGLNQGIAAIVGYYIGKQRFHRAVKRTHTAMKIAVIYMFIAGLVFAVFGGRLIATFFSSDPAVIQLGHILLILSAAFQAFDAINIIAGGALRGAGDTRWMAIATFALNYFVFLPAAMVLAFPAGLGAIGAWIGATGHIIILAGFLFARFARGQWQHIRIFSEDAAVTK
ncbi:MAG: MATE family efflux transporter [Candidatus Hydrogenedentes bacterium]|nr:MATE family efflux transporter [Candidatus Hydrogenedentota bacterium]